jgi:hypothetical protein
MLGRFASAARVDKSTTRPLVVVESKQLAFHCLHSGPTTVKLADQRPARKPSNLPRLPVVLYSANAPGTLQYRNPNLQPETLVLRLEDIESLELDSRIMLRVGSHHGEEGEREEHEDQENLAAA